MRIKAKGVLPILSVLLAFTAAGCGAKNIPDQSKVIAKINNYELTVEDFNSEIDPLFANKYLSKDPIKAKEALLDELITKKVLIQQAQKEGLDKEKQFMKEIERYWEQALLKSLIRNKTKSMPDNMTKSQKEEAVDSWIENLKKEASIQVNKDVLKSVDLPNKK